MRMSTSLLSYIFSVFLIGFTLIIPGGSSIDGSVFQGHEIIQRSGSMSYDGRYTYLDANVTLSRGLLKSFRVYVHNLARTIVLRDVIAHIWRPVEDEEGFTLVWKKRLILEARDRPFIANLSNHDHFQVEDGDLLGFECVTPACPVSMDTSPQGKTYIRPARDNVVGGTAYDFKGPIATVFSIGAEIQPFTGRTVREPESILEESLVNQDELLTANIERNNFSSRETSGLSQEDLPEIIEDIGIENVIDNNNKDKDSDNTALIEVYHSPAQRQEQLSNTQYMGHRLSMEDEYFSEDGRKSFIDTTFKLTQGTLRAVSFYLHPIEEDVKNMGMYIQVWSRTGISKSKFKLDWQKRVQLMHGSNRTYEFILGKEDEVAVTSKHYLGFSCMEHSCPITFEYNEEGRTFFRSIKRYEGPPVLNREYRFIEIHEPILFSIGAYIRHVITSSQQSEPVVELPEPLRLGHTIKPRQYMLPNHPKPKVFIDRSTQLVQGYIRKFIVYIGGLATEEQPPTVRFQVWRYRGTSGEQDKTHPVYELKWWRSFHFSSLTVSSKGNRPEIFEIDDGENRVWVDEHDKIGFISEDQIIPIPYDFNNAIGDDSAIDVVDLISLNRTEEGDIVYPHVRSEPYHFNPIPHPITWSLEVEIQPASPSQATSEH